MTTTQTTIEIEVEAMRFNSEEALQNYCQKVLQHKGIPYSTEVWCGGIRADIVTPDAVYELKKTLDRDALYQALGQATAYNQTLKRPKIRIVGQLPTNTKEQEQARKIAMELQRNSTVEISFIEEDPYWQVQESTTSTPIRNAVVYPSQSFQGREGFQNFHCLWNFQSGNSRGSGNGKEQADPFPPGLFLVIVLLEVAIVLGTSVWSDFTQPAAYSNSNNSHNQYQENPTTNTTSNTISDLLPPVAPNPYPAMQQPMQQAMVQPKVDDLPQQSISDCNRMGKGANLRKYPSLSSKVLTVIQIGDVVSLTGEQVKADGIQWRGVKYRSRGFRQSGWVAGCFL